MLESECRQLGRRRDHINGVGWGSGRASGSGGVRHAKSSLLKGEMRILRITIECGADRHQELARKVWERPRQGVIYPRIQPYGRYL
ncbi:hypothetical protein GCM10009604_01530 [Corynebacterium aurimucosum]